MKLSIIFSFFFLLLCVGCGRKQKHIFHFSDEKPLPKVSKLSLPIVKGLTIKIQGVLSELVWFAVNPDDIADKEISFIGYNVYRLVNSYFVPKKPLNKKIIIQERFTDTSIDGCYLVRPVFIFYNQKIEGLSSQVVCI